MPLKRRDFLRGALAFSTAGIFHLPALAEPQRSVDASRFAILADTHIRTDRKKLSHGICAAKHLQKNIEQILAQPQLPTATIVCGDCAYLHGKTGDYAVLAELLLPLRKAGVPIYLLMGNHDNRHAFWKAFPKQKVNMAPITEEEKHLKVISSPEVDLLLLDTLIKSNYAPGEFGEKQIQWVEQTLKTLDGKKPAVLMAHHHTWGISDYAKLLKVLKGYPQVKAFFYGHLHRWNQKQDGKIWEVSLPASAYVFEDHEPSGWLDTQFHSAGANLTLHTIDEKHPKRGEVVELAWRK